MRCSWRGNQSLLLSRNSLCVHLLWPSRSLECVTGRLNAPRHAGLPGQRSLLVGRDLEGAPLLWRSSSCFL